MEKFTAEEAGYSNVRVKLHYFRRAVYNSKWKYAIDLDVYYRSGFRF